MQPTATRATQGRVTRPSLRSSAVQVVVLEMEANCLYKYIVFVKTTVADFFKKISAVAKKSKIYPGGR